jgi:hypothetical protein
MQQNNSEREYVYVLGEEDRHLRLPRQYLLAVQVFGNC